jgi:hypothetical protein
VTDTATPGEVEVALDQLRDRTGGKLERPYPLTKTTGRREETATMVRDLAAQAIGGGWLHWYFMGDDPGAPGALVGAPLQPGERIPLRGGRPGRRAGQPARASDLPVVSREDMLARRGQREAGRVTIAISREDMLKAAWAQAERRYRETGAPGSPAFVAAVQTLALAYAEAWVRVASAAFAPGEVASLVVAAHRVPHPAVAGDVARRADELCRWYLLIAERPDWLPADWEGRQ